MATASAAPKNEQINVQQLNTDGYDYITIADDGTAYFGKITKRVSDIALLELVVIDDPRNNKTAYKTREAYNCKKNTFQLGKNRICFLLALTSQRGVPPLRNEPG